MNDVQRKIDPGRITQSASLRLALSIRAKKAEDKGSKNNIDGNWLKAISLNGGLSR
jgi:hypothetical protein